VERAETHALSSYSIEGVVGIVRPGRRTPGGGSSMLEGYVFVDHLGPLGRAVGGGRFLPVA
jgi:hypothetical protein